jgi:hypothetical protein
VVHNDDLAIAVKLLRLRADIQEQYLHHLTGFLLQRGLLTAKELEALCREAQAVVAVPHGSSEKMRQTELEYFYRPLRARIRRAKSGK